MERLYSADGKVLPGFQIKGKISGRNLNPCTDNKVRNPDPLFPHQKEWHVDIEIKKSSKLCITTTTAAGLDQILPWIFYHKTIGIDIFLLFVEGNAASENSTSVLEAIPGVRIIFHTKELEEKQAKSRIWNETWLSSFFYRPCNYELFVRQSLNMEMAIQMARSEGVDWIMHIDTDELLYPAGGSEYSLQRLLEEVPDDVDNVIFPNYETAIERDDVKNPFAEVSMFKKNFDHVAKEVYFGHYREATRGNPNYFLTYGNGKAAARMRDNLRPNGAHRWHNYAKAPKEQKLAEAAVLHYTYAKFSDLTSRRDRCGCKPNKEDVKRCFMLEFDREAFIIASTHDKEGMMKWYQEHVVWTDGEVNQKLLKKGLFGRIHTPQVVIRGVLKSGMIEEAMKRGEEMRKAAKAVTALKDKQKLEGSNNKFDNNDNKDNTDKNDFNSKSFEGKNDGGFDLRKGSKKKDEGGKENLKENNTKELDDKDDVQRQNLRGSEASFKKLVKKGEDLGNFQRKGLNQRQILSFDESAMPPMPSPGLDDSLI